MSIDLFMQKLDEYHKELWAQSEVLDKALNNIEDMDSDEYKFKEIEDVSNNGKILAVGSIMSLARGILINPTNEE